MIQAQSDIEHAVLDCIVAWVLDVTRPQAKSTAGEVVDNVLFLRRHVRRSVDQGGYGDDSIHSSLGWTIIMLADEKWAKVAPTALAQLVGVVGWRDNGDGCEGRGVNPAECKCLGKS